MTAWISRPPTTKADSLEQKDTEDTKNSKTGRPQSKFGRRFRSGPALWPSGWAFCELTASLN
jgi:hypothetical protein